ncbi:MAG TPA: NAD(P)-dependent oxidoreductase [Treponema sp.]|nr:NAD(P)-dependent oxidoreductase [Treponema sp.]
MSRLILSGATGMIGAAIVREALRQGYGVTCLVRKDSPRIANIPRSGNVRVVDCDISGYGSLELEGKHDVFVHLAWSKTTAGGRDDVDCQLANIRYTLDAVRLAERSGCRVFIGAGSQAEYGLQSVPLTSSLPVRPESGYGIAKFSAGRLASLLCGQLGMRFNWLRILSVYGPHDGEHSLVSYCVRELLAGRSPELTECAQQWDYLYCDDAARAFLAVAERGKDGAVYPLGSGQGRRLSEYVSDIRDAINPSLQPGFGKKSYYPHQPMFLVADVSELERDTGWRPQVAFAEGIRRVLGAQE